MIKSISILKGCEVKFAGDSDSKKDMKILKITMENGHDKFLDLKENKNIIKDFVFIKIKRIIPLYEDCEIGSKWI